MSHLTQPRPTPTGFLLLGFGMALVALVCGMQILEPDGSVLARFELGMITLVALLLFEALYFVRPWVGRAVDAWTLACGGIVLVSAVPPVLYASAAGEPWPFAVILVMLAAVPLLLLRWYVRHRAVSLGVIPPSRDMIMLRRILARLL